jgi:hypothetical protein
MTKFTGTQFQQEKLTIVRLPRKFNLRRKKNKFKVKHNVPGISMLPIIDNFDRLEDPACNLGSVL